MASLLNMSGGSLLSKGSLLPSGYVQLEYIKNTSKAYIDTGVVPGLLVNFGIEIKLKSDGVYPIGVIKKTGGKVEYQYTISKPNVYRFAVVNDFEYTSLDLQDTTLPTVIKVVGKELWQDGVSYGINNFDDATNITIGSLFIFGWNRCGIEADNIIPATIYYFKATKNGVMVRNMIPCINPNNIAGMYDTVNGVFYSSPNGTAFVAGPEV